MKEFYDLFLCIEVNSILDFRLNTKHVFQGQVFKSRNYTYCQSIKKPTVNVGMFTCNLSTVMSETFYFEIIKKKFTNYPDVSPLAMITDTEPVLIRSE